jgi:transcriptional regulator with XRE-family HTH domain
MQNLIRQKREGKKISQVRLGTLSGLANGTISDFERGTRTPWPKARRALADALSCSEEELFPATTEKVA